MKKLDFIKLLPLTLILCLSFTCFTNVLGQTDSPFCNDCDSVNSKPICSGSQTVKCPENKGNPECRIVNEVCTVVCITGNSSDPDADFCDSTFSSSSSGSVIPISSSSSLNPNFGGTWKGKNIRPNVNSNSLIGCTEIQNCPSNKLHCKSNEIFLPKICTKCASCVTAAKTITLNLCIINGQLKGTINHPGILNNGIIVSQKILTDNVVLLNLKDDNDKIFTLTLHITGNKKLSGTFSNGLGFDARKLNSENSCQ